MYSLKCPSSGRQNVGRAAWAGGGATRATTPIAESATEQNLYIITGI